MLRSHGIKDAGQPELVQSSQSLASTNTNAAGGARLTACGFICL
jgi:hypothetical protein